MSQFKIPKRFNSSTTALDVLKDVNLIGRTALITGASSGIGFETARSLALHGCEVIFCCRNGKSTKEAIEKIETENPKAGALCSFLQVDLASHYSVLKFIEEVKKCVNHIDYLILNAEVFDLPYSRTEEGIETTFQVSHVSHFTIATSLTHLMSLNSRIVVVSSSVHTMANLPAEGLTEEMLSPPREKYWKLMAYNNAKLCNILFARELSKRLDHKGVSVFSVNPGEGIPTVMKKNWLASKVLSTIARPFTKSMQQGAATTVYCAVARELNGLTGLYFNNCYIAKESDLAQNDKMAKSLWEITEKIVQRNGGQLWCFVNSIKIIKLVKYIKRTLHKYYKIYQMYQAT